MKQKPHFILLYPLFCVTVLSAQAFEGRITAVLTRGGNTQTFTYTVDTNVVRLERNESNRPYAINLITLDTGDITLLFPHNRSFMRLKPPTKAVARPDGFPEMPMPPGGLPPGIGPQANPADLSGAPASGAPPAQIGPANLPGMPAMPAEMGKGMRMPAGIGPRANPATSSRAPAAEPPLAQPGPTNLSRIPQMPNMPDMPATMGAVVSTPEMMPGMPAVMRERMPMPGMMPRPRGGLEGGWPGEAPRPNRRRSSRGLQFSATGQTTNLLDYACTRYELRQRDRIMEIWATDQLMPFHPWLQDPPPRHHGPQMMEESWADMLQARKLFPMFVQMKNESGETLPFSFKVMSVAPKHLGAQGAGLFQPPADYHELEPPPF